MFKILMVLLCIFLNFEVSAAASSCEQYLQADVAVHQHGLLLHPRKDLYSRAIDQLISIKYELLATQQQWLRQTYLELKERSIPVRPPGRSVPVVKTQTLRLMWDLQNTLVDSEEHKELLVQISEDPYFEWLEANWDDSKLRLPPSLLVDLSVIQGTVWNPEGELKQTAQSLADYLRQHLFFKGPMQLSPQLLVLRIARDHDAYLMESTFNTISSVLTLQRAIYALDQLIGELGSNAFGTQVQWTEYESLRVVLSEFAALKSKISEMSPTGFEVDYLREQVRGNVPSHMSYEDYIINMYFEGSTDPEEQSVYKKYILLKNIINITALATNRDELDEYLNMRVHYALEYYLY